MDLPKVFCFCLITSGTAFQEMQQAAGKTRREEGPGAHEALGIRAGLKPM